MPDFVPTPGIPEDRLAPEDREMLDDRLPLPRVGMPGPTHDDDTTALHDGPKEVRDEFDRQHAEQDTIDDVEIWLDVAIGLAKRGLYSAGRLADKTITDFRERWPRRDGKDPLHRVKRTLDSDLKEGR